MSKETYVTGARGFVGRNLTERLDNFTSIPHEEIQTTKYAPFDKFYFLSAYGNMASHTDDNEVLDANVGDLIHVLRNTDIKGLKSFVFMSSSSVRLKVQTMYSRTKRASEEILLSFMDKYDAPICIIRPFSITGVGEQPQHLIPTLIRSCMNGDLVNFVPEPVHDFIDVEDVVDGILNLSQHQAKGIYELGSGKQYSNQQVLDIVEKVTGKKANINRVASLRPYDTQDWVSGNFKSRGFGWLPRKSLEQSITEMVSVYAK